MNFEFLLLGVCMMRDGSAEVLPLLDSIEIVTKFEQEPELLVFLLSLLQYFKIYYVT
jgi:hypothetical protein